MTTVIEVLMSIQILILTFMCCNNAKKHLELIELLEIVDKKHELKKKELLDKINEKR